MKINRDGTFGDPVQNPSEVTKKLFKEVDPKKVKINLFGAANPPRHNPQVQTQIYNALQQQAPIQVGNDLVEGINVGDMFRAGQEAAAEQVEDETPVILKPQINDSNLPDAKPLVFGKKKKHIYTAAEKKELGYE